MGNFSNYWDLYTLFTKIKNKIKSVSDSIPTKLSDLTADATHRTVTDAEKSTWNGKSNFSGSYNDLTNKPTIPAAQVNSDWNATTGVAKINNKPTLAAVATSGSYNDLSNKPTIPTKTSELTNNSNFVADSSYVHTDNNYTTAEKTKLSGIASGAEVNVQSDWNQTTTTADDYIKNKPSLASVATSGSYNDLSNKPTIPSFPLSAANGGTGKTTLIDASNALLNSLTEGTSDPTDNDYYISQYVNGGSSVTSYHRRPVSKLWNYIKSKLATVATSGSYNDLSNKPTIPTALSQLTADSTHRLVTDTEKTTWNGKSNFSGSYNDLTNKPTIPTTASDVNAAPAADVPFKFGIDSGGNYGYIKAGADTVTPFKTVGTRSSNIIANGTYVALTDISKDGYSSVTVAVPSSVQTKTVTAGTSNIDVTPDSGYVGLSKVTVSPTPTETKSVTPTTSAQTITPSSGKYLSSVSVGAIQTETKSVTPSSSAQTVTPSSGKYLTSVSVGAVSTQEKTVTSSRSAQTVTPDSGYVGLSKVTVNALAPTGTYTASSRSASLDMGATSNYRYVNTNSVPNSNSSTYTVPSTASSLSDTIDLGSTNSYRYIDATSFGSWCANTAYASRAPKVLWTNPSPGSNFAAKTITISGLKNYSYVFIIGRVTTTLSGYHSILGGFEPNNIGTTWNVDSTYTGLSKINFMLNPHGTISRMRGAYYNGSTQITIGHAFNLGYDYSTSAIIIVSTENSFDIPEKIIGIL